MRIGAVAEVQPAFRQFDASGEAEQRADPRLHREKLFAAGIVRRETVVFVFAGQRLGQRQARPVPDDVRIQLSPRLRRIEF